MFLNLFISGIIGGQEVQEIDRHFVKLSRIREALWQTLYLIVARIK